MSILKTKHNHRLKPKGLNYGLKVRMRAGKLTMTNHPTRSHGYAFSVSGTDGGPTPKGSRWPEVTTDVAVG